MPQFDPEPVGVDALTALALTGYGHFTTMRIERASVRGLDLHLARLVRDCRAVFGVQLRVEDVRRELVRVLGEAADPVVARITVFDADLPLAHPAATAAPRILVTTRPAPPSPQSPMRVEPVRHVRRVAGVKHLGLFDSLYLRRAAQLDGYDDALFHDGATGISEGATWNVGFCRGNQVIWPAADHLPGVTAALLTKVHAHCVTRVVALEELPGLDAAFATNAVSGIRPISAIGSVRFPTDQPILAQLQQEYSTIPPDRLW
jgi:branched-subunit amino acid aminotransferase/4-amino-4-deoxychorismate lyase